MPESHFKKYLSIAKEAAIKAGKFLAEDPAALRKVNVDLIHDVKIEADVQSEKLIVEFLRQKTGYSILSEEAGMIKGDQGELIWIIDPVDGSLNYSREIPICCISIGLWKREEPILGVIYDFNHKELFSAVVGQGAWKNNEPIHVSATDTKQKGILLAGFPTLTDLSSSGIQNFIEHIQTYKKVRLLGSAALSIAYVACGMAEAYYERDIMLWDVAGGIPLILGAGGDVQIEKTLKPHCLNVLVTNGLVNQ